MSCSNEHSMQSPRSSIDVIPPQLTSNDLNALVEDVLFLFNSRQYSLAIHYCEQGMAQTAEKNELRKKHQILESLRYYSQLILIDLEIEAVACSLRQELASGERAEISGLGSMLRMKWELKRAERGRTAAEKREVRQRSPKLSDGLWKKMGKKIKRLF